jgi:hypothetical protein
MSRRVASAAVVVTALVALVACQSSKSSNPLSPTVAGPIPGVNITAPQPADPASGTKVAVDKQPITLMVNNASTSGVRPLTYVIEVATDSSFNNKVFAKDTIAPGGDGHTTLKLPDPLATEKTYYWRARAEDGANTGPYSGAASFNVFTPIVINQPALVAPINNTKIDGLRPRFTLSNAPHSGPVGAISYVLELATNNNFGNIVAIWTFGEQPNQTSFDSPQDLSYTTQYFWHARAYDPTTTGPWSTTQVFQTPDPPPPPPTNPPPGGGGPAPGDALNLHQVTILNSPSDVANWPVTSTITRLDIGSNGVHVEHNKQCCWPDVPFGDGNLQYTLWIVLNVNGQWYGSGCIEFWRGRPEAGGPPSQYAQNWYYDPHRWAPMTGHQPAPGEQVGFLVTAGDARNNGLALVKERSQVVMVPFPGDGGASFTFSAAVRSLMFRR